MQMKSVIRKSVFLAVFGLMMIALSSVNGSSAAASAKRKVSCDRCVHAVQNDPRVCSFLIKVCGVDWFVDPCEFSPEALCECATGCDPSS